MQDPAVRAKDNERQRQRRNNPEFRDRQAEYQRQRFQNPAVRAQMVEYYRQRRQNDPNYRLARSLRSRVHSALKNGWKSASTTELVGCTIDQLREHLEVLFKPGMTWENFGPVWHVDHAKPCASFDLTDPAQQRVCLGFMNLQPMFDAENIAKGAKPETEAEEVGRYDRYWTAA